VFLKFSSIFHKLVHPFPEKTFINQSNQPFIVQSHCQFAIIFKSHDSKAAAFAIHTSISAFIFSIFIKYFI
jgi:uncharacterized protein YhhL (DUF1145 family)